MKRSRENIIEEINSYSNEQLRQASFAYLKILNHLQDASEKENRIREMARIKIAQKHISNYYKEYDGI